MAKTRFKKIMSSINTPIFIIGNGRSGTTMLGEILTSANVGKSFEGHFVTRALKKFGPNLKSRSELQDLIAFIQGFESSKRYRIKLDANDYNTEQNLSTRQIIIDALEQVAKTHPNRRWIEKTPNYIYDLDLILNSFPDAKVIWMVRDGRDVANSVLKKSWGANNVFYAAKAWVAANHKNNALKDSRVLSIKYECFLTQPKEELTKIFNFLNFPCDDTQYFSRTVDASKMNQWKQKMNKQQINIFEAVAFDCLKAHGYVTVNERSPRIPYHKRLWYIVHHHTLLVKHLIMVNIVTPLLIKFNLKLPFNERN